MKSPFNIDIIHFLPKYVAKIRAGNCLKQEQRAFMVMERDH